MLKFLLKIAFRKTSENLKAQRSPFDAKNETCFRHVSKSFGICQFSFCLLSGLMMFTPSVSARNKKAPPPAPKDEIEVVGHVPLTDGPVRRFLATQHYSSYYLYAEHDAGKNSH